VRCNDEVEAQRRRWTFYETINSYIFSLHVSIYNPRRLLFVFRQAVCFRTFSKFHIEFRFLQNKSPFLCLFSSIPGFQKCLSFFLTFPAVPFSIIEKRS